VLQERGTTFCYPYGGFHVATTRAVQLLVAPGCPAAFNVEPRVIEMQDRRSPPRNDRHQFPHGWANHGAMRVA
jgi:hypothetical protein